MSGLGRTIADLELRNARALRAAQERYEAVPDEDEDALTEADALDAAEVEAETTPVMFGDWLRDECCDAVEPVDLIALRGDERVWDAIPFDEHSPVTVPQLVAVMLNCRDSRTMLRAARELRDRFLVAQRGWIQERADELLREQDRERERMREDWEADRYAERSAA